ncbi:MAG TPA: hypothetical protein VFK13_07150 [Gemmatimonadaceae bacterium]|nr:hypothetical protein [Gemmatimonadaceae bacterium]
MRRHWLRWSYSAGLAAAITFGAAAAAGAQQTDSARAAQDSIRRDSLHRADSIARADSMRRANRRATSSVRIPVSKEQRLARDTLGERDTVTATGEVVSDSANRFGRDTLGIGRDTLAGRDTTGLMGRDTTGLMGRDTTGMMRDTLRTDTLRTDTLRTDTLRTDTLRTDTLMNRTDTLGVRSDTIGMRSDTTTIESGGQVSEDTTFYGGNRRYFGNGFYIGVSGGASVPTGAFGDIYDTGFNIDVPLGWQSLTTPWGIRLDGSYDQVMGQSFSATGISSFDASDAKLWSGMLDLTLKFPNGGARTGFYIMGGGGVHHFNDMVRSVTFTTDPITGNTSAVVHTEDDTKFGWNAGAGFSFGIGAADLFVESRYISILTDGENTNYVPVALGVRFF